MQNLGIPPRLWACHRGPVGHLRHLLLWLGALMVPACSDSGLPDLSTGLDVAFGCPCADGFECHPIKNICVAKGLAQSDTVAEATGDGSGEHSEASDVDGGEAAETSDAAAGLDQVADEATGPGETVAELPDTAVEVGEPADAEVLGEGVAAGDADTGGDGATDGSCTTAGAPELCNNKDDNCNGMTDEGCDDDNDDYCDAAMYVFGNPLTCKQTNGGVGAAGNDCNDDPAKSGAAQNPSKSEICNDIDDDCKAGVDEGCDDDNDDYCDKDMTVFGKPLTCFATDGGSGGGPGNDCNDAASNGMAQNPGKTEVCNDLDDNCNVSTDEGCDDDNDNYCDKDMKVFGKPLTCFATDGGSGGGPGDDCNDAASGGLAQNPGKTEVCNDLDDNCNVSTDEGCDDDNDDYCDAAMYVFGNPLTCKQTNGDVGAAGNDCNDDPAKSGAAQNPSKSEICNDIDDDCKAGVDEGCDDDNDDYCDAGMTVVGKPVNCSKTDGGVAPGKGGNDCNDAASGGATQNPGKTEICDNSVDDNCSGATDEGCSTGPAGMVLVPAGKFWMGCNATKDTVCNGNTYESPQHNVTLSAYYIDATEVTVAEYKKCVDASGCAAPGGDTTSIYCNWDTEAKQAKLGRGQHPVNCVNWTEAQKYCKWRGSQVDAANASKYDLPTEAQWEMAARGSCEKNGSTASNDAGCNAAMRTYPWGEQAPSCTYTIMDDGGYGCGASTTAAVGSKAAGDSPYGARDMAGNVYEWVKDWYAAGYYGTSPATDPENTASASGRVIRGGSFSNSAAYLRAGYRSYDAPVDLYYYIGLRCFRSSP
ncbi:MAG: hypothetical protein EXR77_17965 [Myxococcales bacterium]|nr:hypothetical protein [Myxococcales bacterium]